MKLKKRTTINGRREPEISKFSCSKQGNSSFSPSRRSSARVLMQTPPLNSESNLHDFQKKNEPMRWSRAWDMLILVNAWMKQLRAQNRGTLSTEAKKWLATSAQVWKNVWLQRHSMDSGPNVVRYTYSHFEFRLYHSKLVIPNGLMV